MKKLVTVAVPVVILLLAAMLIWGHFVNPGHAVVQWDGEEFDGPLGALEAALFAGGGMLIAAAVIVLVAAILSIVFAGLGLLLMGGLALAAVALAALLSPLMLPLLIPAG